MATLLLQKHFYIIFDFFKRALDIFCWHFLVFLLAFQVSHLGHHRFTFSAAEAPVARSRRRFFLVALSSFLVNEVLYALLLRFTDLDYRVALAIVLVAVAVLTFVSARQWAFAGEEQA